MFTVVHILHTKAEVGRVCCYIIGRIVYAGIDFVKVIHNLKCLCDLHEIRRISIDYYRSVSFIVITVI